MDNFDIDANWNRKLANPIERQNDLSNFECQGQQLDVTDGRLEYVHL